jgi:hypothetical protein
MADDDLPPMRFPTECLPAAAGDMVRAIAAAERVPESLTGCCVLGILSASIGAGLQVQSGAQRVTRGNVYLVASADSGTGKSESIRHAAQPLYAFEKEIVDSWKAATLPGLQAEKDLLESEVNSLKKQVGKKDTGIEREATQRELEEKKARLLALEGAMQSPILTIEDITTERLASLLEKRGECLASISSDAGKVIQNVLGRYTEGRTDENLLLKAYSGDPVRVDRVMRPPTMLQRPCLSLLWLVQPDKVDTLLGERSLTDGGLIPRLLICHSNAQPTHITSDQQGIPSATLQGWDALVRELLTAYCHNSEPFTIDPTPAAMQLLIDHHNCVVDLRLGEMKDITSFAARWTEQAWRLSVVLHAAQHGAQAHLHPLSAETARDAIAIADWFAAKQLEILSGGRMKAQRDKRNEVLLLLVDHPDGITARLVQRVRIADPAEDAHELLQAMEKEGILAGEDITPEHGGHTVRIYKQKATC